MQQPAKPMEHDHSLVEAEPYGFLIAEPFADGGDVTKKLPGRRFPLGFL
jgi:hypothetical protein